VGWLLNESPAQLAHAFALTLSPRKTTVAGPWSVRWMASLVMPLPLMVALHLCPMLRIFKSTVERAGLNPAEYYLHKFRATFATTCLQAGIDLKTVQQWLGDLPSTVRYLK
jgi:Phage integrase family